MKGSSFVRRWCRSAGYPVARIAGVAWRFLLAGLVGCGHAASPAPPAPETEGSAPLAVIPFELSGGWIYLRGVINGHSAWLVLDTGASYTALDRLWAWAVDSLPYYCEGTPAICRTTAPWGGVDVIRLADDLEVHDYRLGLDSLRGISEADGRAVNAVLGRDVMQRFTVEIDYNARRLRLYDPARYHYSGAGVILPFVYSDNRPIVRGYLVTGGQDSINARLLLDTGTARLCALLNTRFVERHHLAQMVTPAIEGPLAAALWGRVRLVIGRLKELRIGTLTSDSVVVGLGTGRRAFLTAKDYDGLLGNTFFRGSLLVLDFARHRAIVEPRTDLGRDCQYDHSGLQFTAHGPLFREFKVDYVVSNSPAAQAGIQPGDELLSLDGRAARDLDLDDIRQALTADGAIRQLRLARGADTMVVSLKLRPLF